MGVRRHLLLLAPSAFLLVTFLLVSSNFFCPLMLLCVFWEHGNKPENRTESDTERLLDGLVGCSHEMGKENRRSIGGY